ncbi:hypothetical protein HX13_01690 [Chryseobacterium sp. P1-3]|nr:hypothetical protein HX13_01690 [Chryseobacterium sp. P1-3]
MNRIFYIQTQFIMSLTFATDPKSGGPGKSLVNLNRKSDLSFTLLGCIPKFLILALKDSAAALV